MKGPSEALGQPQADLAAVALLVALVDAQTDAGALTIVDEVAEVSLATATGTIAIPDPVYTDLTLSMFNGFAQAAGFHSGTFTNATGVFVLTFVTGTPTNVRHLPRLYDI